MKKAKPPKNNSTEYLRRRTLRNRWRKMVRRCYHEASRDFGRYGGRGIGVDPQWLGPDGFDCYFDFVVNQLDLPEGSTLDEILFQKPAGARYSLDRIDNDAGYGPNNLRWATDQQQSDNQQRTVYADVDGALLPRPTAARRHGVDPRTSAGRQRVGGYGVAEAVSLPTGGRTANTRRWRDRVIVAMIDAGELAVNRQGFVFVRSADGWHLPPIGTAGAGRYIGVSITVPRRFHHLIPVGDRPESGKYRSMFQHARAVALFHHPLPDDGAYYEVDHLNMNSHDDRPENLRWQVAQDNRADGHRDRGPSLASPVLYTDPLQQTAALNAKAAEDTVFAAPFVPVDQPSLPANAPSETVEDLLAAMRADPDFPRSVWAQERYWPILRDVLAASGNHASLTGGQVTVECESTAFDGVRRVLLLQLSTSSRVYHACPRCGRQSFAKRTEVRNRVRYPNTQCESCNALDLRRPDLADRIAGNPETGVRRDPSRITVGSSEFCHFRCRDAECPNVIKRKVKTLARLTEPPICEAHRARGKNFDVGGGSASKAKQREGDVY